MLHSKLNPKIGSIIFPWGGGGNHLRWLLFLDKKCDPAVLCNDDIDSKLAFIQAEIYPPHRTWNNWLGMPPPFNYGFEWTFRTKLGNKIAVSHEIIDYKNCPWKELYFTYDNYELPLQHYFHINLGLNSNTPNTVRNELLIYSNKLESLRNSFQGSTNKKILKADKLYEKKLDYSFYKEVVDFFEFDDLFEKASLVHDWYYSCRVTSARDFCNYVRGPEFKKYFDILDKFATQ